MGTVSVRREGFQDTVDFEPVRVGLSQLPSSYYVSEILYGGATVKGRFADIASDSVTQSIEFTISEKAATIQGRVSKENAPTAANVLLIPRPMNPQADFPAYFDGEAGDDGRFSIAGLPPGAYHVLAVSSSAWNWELQKPGILAALEAGAKEINLDPVSALPFFIVPLVFCTSSNPNLI